jgi:hypothetical protein
VIFLKPGPFSLGFLFLGRGFYPGLKQLVFPYKLTHFLEKIVTQHEAKNRFMRVKRQTFTRQEDKNRLVRVKHPFV